ncbi:MAG: DNA replication and repair protein RecF [Melioribacteraceae bacterium]
MILQNIEMTNFRLHSKTSLNFSDKINYIIGGNGEGKTSILEAIYYLCTTKNLNSSSDSDAVKFNEKFFDIKGNFRDLTENKIRVLFDTENNKKNCFIDEKSINRSASLIGKFPIVTLIQSDHSITSGSPAERRRFVDSVISQSSDTYLKILIDFNKILKQRAVILSELREFRRTSLVNQLDAWSEALVKNGSEIIRHRIKFIEDFNEYVKNAYMHVMEERETPQIILQSFQENLLLDDIDRIYSELLKEAQNDEIRRASNLIGPHRDDFIFKINDRELKRFGSQGQHKTFQIALRFGQFFYMLDKMGRKPVFLMDDVFGELDKGRAYKISKYLSELGQTFITMTDLTNIDLFNKETDYKIININSGAVVNA